MIDAIIEAASAIVEESRAPLSEAAGQLGCSTLGYQLCAFERGNLLLNGLSKNGECMFYLCRAGLCGIDDEETGEQRGLTGVAEKRNLGGAKTRCKLTGDLRYYF